MQTTELSNSSEKELLAESTMISSMLSNQNTEEINKPSLICINGVEAHYVCMNKNCKYEQAIICNDNTCGCRNNHRFCFRTEILSVIETIEEKAFAFKNIEEKINKTFENIIDKISEMRDNFIQFYQELFKEKSYFPHERQFFNEIKKNSGKKITGEMMSEIYGSIYERSELDRTILIAEKSLNKSFEKFMKEINEFGLRVEKELSSLQTNFLDEKENTYYHFGLFKKSKIVETIDENNKLLNFFPSKVSKAELIFKGSKDNFNVDDFHKNCDDVESVMILIRTEQEKIIGGYTPLGFSSQSKGNRILDHSLKSFMFSLTEGDKLALKRAEYALTNFTSDSDYLWRFGDDLHIANYSKPNIKSKYLLDEYTNSKYSNNKEGYKKFTGSESSDFEIDSFEVWKIMFE